jgi:hypothetical protein
VIAEAVPKHTLVIISTNSTGRLTLMLAEKFILLLETLLSRAHRDGAPRVVTRSPFVPLRQGCSEHSHPEGEKGDCKD